MLTLIVIRDQNWAIGKEGGLLCSLKEDMTFFKEKTWGHTVILGRKTLESFPGQKPLASRKHIVLTKDIYYEKEGVLVAHSVEEALEMIGHEHAFCIGGGMIYEQLLPYCSDAYITEIDADLGGDVFLPKVNEMSSWTCIHKEDWRDDPRFRYRFTYWKRLGE